MRAISTSVRHATMTIAVIAAAGCVDHPDFLDSQKVKTWEERCEGDAPTCLSSCGERAEVGVSTCKDSKWACAEGIRADLCCDPTIAPDHCATWEEECSIFEPCPGGYTCVKSRTHPVPSDRGLCRLGDLSIPNDLGQCNSAHMARPELIPFLGLSPVKVHGVVNVQVSCEDRKCTQHDPCCQACAGAYRVDLVEDDGRRFTLPIRTESIACVGTNCGYSCSPMQPGRRYLIWGLYLPGSAPGVTGNLYYAGHCDG